MATDGLETLPGRTHRQDARSRRRHVAQDAVVIDVGTTPTPDAVLVGDVAAVSVAGRAAGLTPVPGGVGPVTTALLLRHPVVSARG